MFRVCVFIVSVCVFGATSLSGRGFFCRDPDTGELHAVNTTWQAISFCGNYHCKLRRKNITNTEYPLLRLLNITNMRLVKDKTEYNKTTKESRKNSVENKINANISLTSTEGLDSRAIEENEFTDSEEIILKMINDTKQDRNDRYLTDSEIKSISEILQTMKKSDLDAIIEIYNLAQDIYKNIDTPTSIHRPDEALITDDTTKILQNIPGSKTSVGKHGHVSYWYEPLINKLKSDIKTEVVAPASISSVDRLSYLANSKHITTNPTPSTVTFTTSRRVNKLQSDSFFSDPLSLADFAKLPYYYTISKFQSLSSYIHHQDQKQQPKNQEPRFQQTGNQPSAYQQLGNQVPNFQHHQANKLKSTNQYPSKSETVTNTPIRALACKRTLYNSGKYQKEIKPSIWPRYPFSNIHHYNFSYPLSAYINDYARKRNQSIINNNKNEKRVVELRKAFETKPLNAVLMNPDLENFQDLQIRPSKAEEKVPVISASKLTKEDTRRPDWQTDPLPNEILEEIRARVQKKQKFMKPLPIRKKVKLESLLNLGEITRVQRTAIVDDQLEPELYEVYIEKTKCVADYAVPGFFRYGNLSQPYPECCPQRIISDR